MRSKVKYNIIILTCALILFSCASQNYENNISCSREKLDIKKQDIWDHFATSVHKVKCDKPVMMVNDVCLVDSICYVLYNDNSLVAINLNNNIITGKLDKTGHSKTEFIKPLCITADKNNVYVYDNGKFQCMVFDRKLKYKKSKFFYDVVPNKMIKTKDGILFYDFGNGAWVSHLDNKFRMKSKTTISSLSYNLVYNPNPFIRSNDSIYVRADANDSVYVWKDGRLYLNTVVRYADDYESKSIESSNDLETKNKEITLNYFILDGYLLVETLKGSKIGFYFIDPLKDICSYGIPPMPNKKYPFTPEWQFNNTLLKVKPMSECRRLSCFTAEEKKEECELVIFKYDYKP